MIVRSARSQNFTITSNAILEDSALDWRDVGLLVYLLSKPDYWKVSTAHLASVKKTKIDGVKASLKALRAAGYVQLKKLSTGHSDWHVFDMPQLVDLDDEQPAPNVEKPKVDYPSEAIEKPKVDYPSEGKSTPLVSTEYKQVRTDTNNVREPTLIADDFEIDDHVKFRLAASGVPMVVAEFLLVEFVNKNISTGYVSRCWAAELVSYCKIFEWRYKKHEQAARRIESVSGKTNNSAASHHDWIKKSLADALAEEQGAETVQSLSSQVHPSLVIGNGK